MKDADLARWAAKFAKGGTRAQVELDEDDEPAPPRAAARTAPGDAWGQQAPARRGQVWGPPPETDTLVMPGPSLYKDIMRGVPDLAPDMSNGADAMEGRMSPESAALVREALAGEDGYDPGAGAYAPRRALPKVN